MSFHFSPDWKLWANALGICGVIGTALYLSVDQPSPWQTFRLYLMPFCVSSFATLAKDRGFVVIFSPQLVEVMTAIACCGFFLAVVGLIKLFYKKF